MKQNLTTILTLLTLTTFSVFGQTNQNVTVADVPKISVVGVGTVTVFPNAAQITIALKFIKPTLREAINDNQKTASEVLTIIKKFVSDTTGIKVSLISTDKSMRYDNTLKKDVFVGFESTQKIIFTLHAAMPSYYHG